MTDKLPKKSPQAKPPKPSLSTKKRVAFGLIVALLAPLILAVFLEATLRFIDYGVPTSFVLVDESGTHLRENPKFAWPFHSPATPLRPRPFRVSTTKPDNLYRIVVLGESAAAGTPEPGYGFARILEHMLQFEFPNRQFEIINASMRGINSHVIHHIARDTLQLDPDLYIVYSGNNECVGLHAPSPDQPAFTGRLGWIQFQQAVRSSKTGQWIWNRFNLHQAREQEKQNQDMDFFRRHRLAFDSPGRHLVYENFEANLREILKPMIENGIPVLLSTLSANLRDCPPLASLNRSGLPEDSFKEWQRAYQLGVAAQSTNAWAEALNHFQQAVRLDDHHAELHYRIGLCHLELNQPEKAVAALNLACDWDALPFRSDRRINEAIRNVAESISSSDVHFLDLRERFQHLEEEDPAAWSIAGNDLFYDHVHFNFNGDYLVAKAMFLTIAPRLQPDRPTDRPVLSKTKCALRLGLTTINEAQMVSAIVEVLSSPPFLDQMQHGERIQQQRQRLESLYANLTERDIQTGITVFERAIANNSLDWQLHYNFGLFYMALNQFENAAQQFQKAADLMPHHIPIWFKQANALFRGGQTHAGIELLRKILQMDPTFSPARDALAQLNAL